MIVDGRNTGDADPFAALRRIAQRPPARDEERCDMCGEPLPAQHRHLLTLATREVSCACRACALLLDAPVAGGAARRLIPTRVQALAEDAVTSEEWNALQVPVEIAFFCCSTAAGRVTAFYPSPMGPTEARLPPDTWEPIADRTPALREMEADVEALLVRRGTEGPGCYLVPIDECYRLVGLIRVHWRGLSGGTEVRREIERFFAHLAERAAPAGGARA